MVSGLASAVIKIKFIFLLGYKPQAEAPIWGSIHIWQNLSLLKELLRPFWQNPIMKNRHKTP